MKKSALHLKHLLLISAMILQVLVYAQPGTNKQRLNELSDEYKSGWQKRKADVEQFSRRNNLPIRQELPNGRVFELIAVEAGRPVYYTTDNVNAAATTRANKLWSGGGLGLTLDGTGFNGLAIWDGGAVLTTHQEFNNTGTGRVTKQDGATTVSAHATHVSGTLVGGGVTASARGMASNGNLKAYEWTNDNTEMASAAAGGLLISNHSYGYIRGWYNNGTTWSWYGNTSVSTQEDYQFGLYDSEARAWDEIAYNAPYYLIVKSAGNDRGEGPTTGTYPVDGYPNGYDCIGNQGVAKNILTVGAVNDVTTYSGPGSVAMSSFSGWGPADDGRIKPDIVGNGIGLYSSVSTSTSSYASYSGTSMSSPNVAGTLVLLQQHFRNLNGGTSMRAATLKSLVINTADECGAASGPDYQFGWGLLNAARAAELITRDATNANVIDERTLNNQETQTLEVSAFGTEPLIVSIVWTDPPGTAQGAVLDPLTPALVNDLDLRLLRNETTYFPYKLDRNNPAAAATASSENNTDNAELVYIAAPTAGVYTVQIDHDGTLAQPQHYSLVISGGVPLTLPPADAGISQILTPVTSFCGSAITPVVVLKNFDPAISLTSIDILCQLDGGATVKFSWTGSLGPSASVEVTLPEMAVTAGPHTLTAFTSLPNHGSDPNPANDQTQKSFNNTSQLINSFGFETGMGIWTDPGTDCARSTSYPNSGSYGLMLRDNTTTSLVTTSNLNLLSFETISVAFSYYTVSMDNSSEDFWLQISKDGGVTFTTVEEWNLGDEFQNGRRYHDRVTLAGPFTASTRLRFRCDASYDDDQVHLDDIEITGCSSNNQPPVALFSYLVDCLSTGFTDASTDDGAITAWQWNFGDGSSSSLRNPTHTYISSGTYTVTLTVTDDAGITASTSQTVATGNVLSWYRDQDGDSYGNPLASVTACAQPAGYVSNNGDCNDGNPAIHPGAAEVCDGVDNDCDGQVDEGLPPVTYYADNDGDSYGNPLASVTACARPAGYVSNNGDCNDGNPAIHPGAAEVCDGVDNDCDGQVDEGLPPVTYYADNDGDSYGNPLASVTACARPAGYVSNNGDCNDGNPAIYPGAAETCDGVDNNCDGQVDEGCSTCVYELVNLTDFESSMGIWSDGGTDCGRGTVNPNSGSYCAWLRDNTYTSVLSTTSSTNLSPFEKITIEFSFLATGFDSSTEDFWFQLSNTSGWFYTTLEEWNLGDEFQNNVRYNVSLTLQGPFTTYTRLRFRCDASDDDDIVYIDDVKISGCRKTAQLQPAFKSASLAEVLPAGENYSIQVYPNPFNDRFDIRIKGPAVTDAPEVAIMDLTGRTLYRKSFEPDNNLVINNLKLISGAYFVRVQLGKAVLVEKLVKTD